MKFKIIRHTYENTGGGTMVGFDEVWLPEEDRTIFVRTNEMGSSFWTVDAYAGELDDKEPFALVELDGGKWLEHRYFKLAKACMHRYVVDEGHAFLPYAWLPDEVQLQVSPHYYVWCEANGELYETDGHHLIINEHYAVPEVPTLDNKTYHRLMAALYAMKDAFHELNEVWDGVGGEVLDELGDSYPFEYSFDEMAIKVQEWVWNALHEADKRKPEVQ